MERLKSPWGDLLSMPCQAKLLSEMLKQKAPRTQFGPTASNGSGISPLKPACHGHADGLAAEVDVAVLPVCMLVRPRR